MSDYLDISDNNSLFNPDNVGYPVCNDREPMSECVNPDCSWFNHSQVGLQGGDVPTGYELLLREMEN